MPARSQSQRAYLNARMGHVWVKRHGFDNTGKLPGHAPPRKGPKGTRSSIKREQMIAQFMRKHGSSKR